MCLSKRVFFLDFFKIGRGCRQGDPVSSYIFLICVEIMATMIRENKEIRGIYIKNKEYKLLQYADDTALLLDGSEKSLKNALSIVDQFSKFSCLKPNYTKTVCVKIGTLRDSDLTFSENYKLI